MLVLVGSIMLAVAKTGMYNVAIYIVCTNRGRYRWIFRLRDTHHVTWFFLCVI